MERECFNVSKDEVDDYTQESDWIVKGEVFKFIDTFRSNGDGEWHAVIVQRQSDLKYFRFDYGYGDTKNYYEPEWREVIPKEESKIKWSWDLDKVSK